MSGVLQSSNVVHFVVFTRSRKGGDILSHPFGSPAREISYTYLIFLVNVGTPTSEQSPSRAKAGDRIEATTAFLARYEPVFPQRIGELVIQLRTAIRIPASAVTRGLDREDLFGISSAVADVTSEIRAEIQKQLR